VTGIVRCLLRHSLVGCVYWWLLSSPGLAHSMTGEAPYEQLITTTAQWHGLDPALVKAVIKCESGFDPWAQSPKGAQGLMQLMPSTQTMLGVRHPFEPRHNVEAGARYLAMLTRTFNGNVQLALAAYNAGPQAVVAAGYSVPAISETQQYIYAVFSPRTSSIASLVLCRGSSLCVRSSLLRGTCHRVYAPSHRQPQDARHCSSVLYASPARWHKWGSA
jgi:hypothetical protein